MSSTQEKIEKLLDTLAENKKVVRHYNETLVRLEDAYKRLEELRVILEKEFHDVQEIEKLGVKSLFRKMLGSQEQQLEKERQEYLQASLRYNEFKKSVELLEFERDILKKKVINVDKLEKDLKLLKVQREKELLISDSPEGRVMAKLVKRLDHIISHKKDINQALDSGTKSAQYLNRLIHFLEAAGEWGNWDMRSYNVTAQREAMDRAREAAYYVKHHLNKFQKDLYQIRGEKYNLNIDIGAFNNFSDVFFDNLISDWIIQQKIRYALRDVNALNNIVNQLLQEVQIQLQKVQKDAVELIKQKDELILFK